MLEQPLHLKSSTAIIKNHLLVKVPMYLGIVFVIVQLLQLSFSVDELLLNIGLYFLALILYWLIYLVVVIPITKNDIVIDSEGIRCAKINKYEFDGFISWSCIEAIDIKYGHRSPTILIDIYPSSTKVNPHLKPSSDESSSTDSSKIRLRINFISSSLEEIKQYVQNISPVP